MGIRISRLAKGGRAVVLEALVCASVSINGRAEDVDALIRLADEAAAKELPAGPLTNKSVPEHRLVGVSCG